MYRVNEIKKSFIHLLGWRQHFDTTEFSITEDLTQSETGQYFQDIHPMLTLENVYDIAPDFTRCTYEEWNQIIEYKTGKMVKLKLLTFNEDYNTDFEKKAGYAIYRAKRTNTGKNPEISPDDWQHVDLFSEWLEQKTAASILRAIERFYSEKLVKETARNLLESKVLFDGAGRLNDVVRNTNSLVGFEVVPIRAEGITTRVDKIGLQFNKNGSFDLYVMHSSSPTPINTIRVDYTGNGAMQWIDAKDLYLPYMSENTDAGGSWFICYRQTELPDGMMAVQKNRDWSKSPCASCNRNEYAGWQIWSRYIEIHPFKVPAPEDVQMWDVEQNVYTYQTNYGINMKITVECDLTDILVSQRRAFQNVIGLQVAADMLREFAYNPNFRINRAQQNFSRNELLYELDGDSQGYKKSGIMHQLDKAMEALDIDTSGINRVCLPCQNYGIRYTTI